HVTSRSRSRGDAGALSPVRNQRVQLGLGSRLRDAVFQTADEIEIVDATILAIAWIQSERKPDLSPRVHQIRSRRENADHLAGPAFDIDGRPDPRAPAERALPELVREHDDRLRLRRRLSLRGGRTGDLRLPFC